jgi:flagellar export protein FliJ
MAVRRFRFAPLLDHAEQREDEQSGVLAQALRAEAAASETLQMLIAEREQQLARLDADRGPFSPEERAAALGYIDHLGRMAEEQQRTVAALHEQTEAERAALLALSREKQSLERLRDRDALVAAEAEARREASQADDLNMGRHIRRTQANAQASAQANSQVESQGGEGAA